MISLLALIIGIAITFLYCAIVTWALVEFLSLFGVAIVFTWKLVLVVAILMEALQVVFCGKTICETKVKED